MSITDTVRKESLQVHSMLRHIAHDMKKAKGNKRKMRKTLDYYALYLTTNETALKAFNYYLVREHNPAMTEPDLIAKLFLAAQNEFKGGWK